MQFKEESKSKERRYCMWHVSNIFIAVDKGLPMQEMRHVLAIKGVGLEGDRYATGKGLYSSSQPPKIRHITLIAAAAIAEGNLLLDDPFKAAETRRQIVIGGISSEKLNEFVGRRMRLGSSGPLIQGVELCTPCDWLDKCKHGPDFKLAPGQTGFKKAFENRGGLRAAIIETGRIIRDARVLG